MNIDAQRVIDAYQVKLAEVTTQLVMMTALAEQLKAELDAAAAVGPVESGE